MDHVTGKKPDQISCHSPSLIKITSLPLVSGLTLHNSSLVFRLFFLSDKEKKKFIRNGSVLLLHVL